MIKYWREIAILALSVVIIGLSLCANGIKKDLKAEKLLKETAELNYKTCQSDTLKSREVSNGYQVNITALRSQLNRLRNSSKCIIPTSSGGGYNGTTTGNKLSDGNGISSNWLYDFAGRAEETRLKLLGCQSFVKQVCEK